MTTFQKQIATATLILVLCGIGLTRRIVKQNSTPADPQSAIYEMVNAARSGDVKRYLASFTGPLRDTLRRSLAESTESEFAKYLRDTHAGIKGLAVTDPQELTKQQVRARIEYVYQERNDTQTVYLDRSTGGWKIARVDGDQQLKALIPYGTPVR